MQHRRHTYIAYIYIAILHKSQRSGIVFGDPATKVVLQQMSEALADVVLVNEGKV